MKNNKNKQKLLFINKVIDKNQLKKLISLVFRNYGIATATNLADKLKELGFTYATQSGISLSIEDLKIPPIKKELIQKTIQEVKLAETKYSKGEITAVERFQKVIDTWNNASESLKNEVIQYFKQTDPLNPVYMMALSGARGNISQVRQLVGMRGLMADPQGQIIDLPIASNFREGLTVTEYFISSYGARKGLVDTALRTADSGYLTRRLVDVAQDVIIRETDCNTQRGILLEDMINNQRVLIPLEQSLIGRVLAENLYNLQNGQLIAKAKQDIDPYLSKLIVSNKIKKVLVRSPLTCESQNSVCQYCYGWNLAHGKLVDLGEAVGIIAAQSIGEPGTQLTMRTFHTGGIFTGEIAEQIYSPCNGKIKYPGKYKLSFIRTRHGEDAYLVEGGIQLTVENINGGKYYIPLNDKTILFAKNGQEVKEKEIIAESTLNNRLERAQKHIVTDISGRVHLFSNLFIEESNKKSQSNRIIQDNGLIWILSGQVYNIPDEAVITTNTNENVNRNSVLARLRIINKYQGIVRIPQSDLSNLQKIQIITSSTFLSKSYLFFDKKELKYILKLSNQESLILRYNQPTNLQNYQIIADLSSDNYKTLTGGIIKYLDLPVSKQKTGKYNDAYDILGPGYLLWISEETHEINKDVSLLMIKNGDFIEAGTEIVKNIFCKNNGVAEVIQKDGIIREIIIKPGKLYTLNSSISSKIKNKGFLRPGEKILNNLITEKLVYWEHIISEKTSYILIRPVIIYSIPAETDTIQIKENHKQGVRIQVLRRISYKDGERIKSIDGIKLITTHLVVNIPNSISDLTSSLEIVPNKKNCNQYQVQILTFETLSIKQENYENDTDHNKITQILVKNNQYVQSFTIIAHTEIISKDQGYIESINKEKQANRRILLVTNKDERIVYTQKETSQLKQGDWVYQGDYLTENIITPYSGQISLITKDKIFIRIGRPYLVSSGTILYVNHNDFLKRGETLATLVYERAKTGDIIQGLPRIEEILEARKKTNGKINPHSILDTYFNHYLNNHLSLYESAQLSLREIQSFLVNEVQMVYQSQNVEISDKHIEVIVRQMTSKVKIENGGSTGYLPGELLELQKMDEVNKNTLIQNKLHATYSPILLGITKASLNTDSFISAASFQETTKVLTEAAIGGKLDWLRGLKENVIIGRLIPAGTGFNIYKNNQVITNYKTMRINKDYDDIILDDRTARSYPYTI